MLTWMLKTIKNRVCKGDFSWIPNVCACKCNKKCEFDNCLKKISGMKSTVYKLVITRDEIMNT